MNKPRQIELTLLMILTCMFLHFLVKFHFLAAEYNPVYDQALISAICCMLVCKLLDFHCKFNWILIVGQLYFIGLCILLYYAETWADYLAFAICAWSDVKTLLYAKSCLKNGGDK